MTVFMSRSIVVSLQLFVDELVKQATNVGMMVNVRQERLIGSVVKDSPPPVNLSQWNASRLSSCWAYTSRVS